MRIAAIDPGKTTGFALWDERPGTLNEYGEVGKTPELLAILGRFKPDVLVVEAYRLYPWRAKEQLWGDMPSPQVIGALKAWAELNKVRYVEQSASIKRIMSDDVLKRAGYWFRGKEHARDAARHLLYYLWRNGHEERISKLMLEVGGSG